MLHCADASAVTNTLTIFVFFCFNLFFFLGVV